jgi:hypothetical protein
MIQNPFNQLLAIAKRSFSFFTGHHLILTCIILTMASNQTTGQKFTCTYGNSTYNEGVASFQLPDSGYLVVANTTGFQQATAPYLLWIDQNGQYQRDKVLPCSHLATVTAVTMMDQYLYLGGFALVQGDYQFMLLKSDTSGALISEKYWGGKGWDFMRGLTGPAGDTLYYCGESTDTTFGFPDAVLGAITVNGNLLWHESAGDVGYDSFLSIDTDGPEHLICAGATGSPGSGDTAIFIAGYTRDGQQEWFNIINDPGLDMALKIHPDLGGGYYLCGLTHRWPLCGQQGFLMKTDTSGTEQWIIQYNDTVDDGILDAIQLPDTNYIVAGYYDGEFSSGMREILLSNCGKEGYWNPLLPSVLLGGLIRDEEACQVIQTMDGGFLVTGTTHSVNTHLTAIILLKCTSAGSYIQPTGHQTYITPNHLQNDFGIYPDPAGPSLFVSLPENLTKGSISLEISDLSGHLVHLQQIEAGTDGIIQIHVDELKPGVYVIRYGGISRLFIKQ